MNGATASVMPRRVWLTLQKKHPVTRKLLFAPSYNWPKAFADARGWLPLPKEATHDRLEYSY